MRASFYGHTHDEQFYVTRGIRDKKPVGVNLVTGSATVENGRNSGFTVVALDKATLLPMNVATYLMNLTDANSQGENGSP